MKMRVKLYHIFYSLAMFLFGLGIYTEKFPNQWWSQILSGGYPRVATWDGLITLSAICVILGMTDRAIEAT